MSAKEELAAIARARDWAMINALDLQLELNRVRDLIRDYQGDLGENWRGATGEAAQAKFESIATDFQELRRTVQGIIDVLDGANVSLQAARTARENLPSPVVPAWISDLADSALNDNQDNFFVDGVAFATQQGVAGVESFFGNREENAASEALRELKSALEGPGRQLDDLTGRLIEYAKVYMSPEELHSYFELEFANPDAPSVSSGGGGGSGSEPGTFGGGGGGTVPTGPGGGPRPPLPPGTPWPHEPDDPRPPWAPGTPDDGISIDDGSAGAYGRGLGAAALGGAGIAGGAWAANSARARATGAGLGGGSTGGPGGLMPTSGTGIAGATGTGAGNSGGVGMMGGQGGRGGSEKDKKPTLAGYKAPSLDDDDDSFTPLPDSARAGGRSTEPDEPA
jgi:hypothetical protein